MQLILNNLTNFINIKLYYVLLNLYSINVLLYCDIIFLFIYIASKLFLLIIKI